MTTETVSVVLPAKNEAATITDVIGGLRRVLPKAELIVVDDGSSDGTGALAAAAGARVLRHPVCRGNGAAIKTGVRHAGSSRLVFMDADGQHDPSDVMRLLKKLDEGYDMAIGARAASMHAGLFRLVANRVYNTLASWMTGVPIADLTSGFRAVRTDHVRRFLNLLPNGFSYPTTITMAFLRAGYGVAFEPVRVRQRTDGSKSHIRPFRDGARFLVIIFKVATLYSPLKVFVPTGATIFGLGLLYYSYTFFSSGRFTNLGALLFMTAVLVFLIGLVSEQITQLLFAGTERGHNDARAAGDAFVEDKD